ncbi:hypothetical protein D3C78_1029320 [compost metagenome]
MQAGVGGCAGVGVVDTGLRIVRHLLFAEQALALDIGAQADSAQGFDQAHGDAAFADGGNTVGDGQEA